MRRALAVLLCTGAVACAPRRPPAAPPALFPVTALWTVKLADFPEGPLAADDRRVFVATRAGSVHAFDRASGAPLWEIKEGGGLLASAPDALVMRNAAGTVSRLRSRSGETLWKTDTGVPGALPPVVDGELVLVAGQGLAALDLQSGRVLWRIDDPPIASTVPAASRARIVLGETDGTLRCRDRATGQSRWTHRLRSAPLAPPLLDPPRRLYQGTTDRRLLSLRLDDGKPGWSWKVGADVQSSPVAFRDNVVFAALDAVLYALKRRNGHLVWRASLPSRPLGPPLVVGTAILQACAENDILGFDGKTGAKLGGLKTAAEIRTPVLVADGRLYVGLRDRSVAALALAGSAPSQP